MMMSPLPAKAEDALPVTDQPIEFLSTETEPTEVDASPYPRRQRRGFSTLPNVTLKQHRLAAVAGGGVTLFALCGFAALLVFAPREERIRSVEVPTAASTNAVEPAGEVVHAKPQATALPVSASVEARPAQLALPASATRAATAAALPLGSPRWGDSTGTAEENAEALIDESTTQTISPEEVRSITDPDAELPLPAVQDDIAPQPDAAKPVVRDKPSTQEKADQPDTSTTAAIPKPAAASVARPARVTKYVNLRSRPNDDSKVLRVVPAKASLSVIGCKSWCEVVYEGTRGYVYKSFVK